MSLRDEIKKIVEPYLPTTYHTPVIEKIISVIETGLIENKNIILTCKCHVGKNCPKCLLKGLDCINDNGFVSNNMIHVLTTGKLEEK